MRYCDGKNRYDKKTAQTIVNFRRGDGSNRTKRADKRLRIYRCKVCNYWHITHLPLAGKQNKFRPLYDHNEINEDYYDN